MWVWTCLFLGDCFLSFLVNKTWASKQEPSIADPFFACEYLLHKLKLASVSFYWFLEARAGCSDDSAIEDLTESEMENIDLSENVKLDESCVIVDNSFLYEVSRRNRRLRSYKVLLSLSLCICTMHACGLVAVHPFFFLGGVYLELCIYFPSKGRIYLQLCNW